MPAPQTENPTAQAEYLRALLAQQANTTGMTQMGPGQTPTPPTQTQRQQPGAQTAGVYGPGQRGAHQRESMQNLVKASTSLANQFSQYAEQKQQRQYQQVVGRFTAATQGVTQAQSQAAQAAAALKQNPQDPQAQAQLKQAQQALQQNQTILNDMANDPKAHKVITKAFGIDDKNADSPERQAAMEVLKKQGQNPALAGINSQIPQTQQLSPQAQAQSQMQQAGVVGKPATQGQLIAAVGKSIDQEIKMGTATDKLVPVLAKTGLMVQQGEDGTPMRNEDGTLKIVPMTPEQRALIPGLRVQDDYKKAQTDLMEARATAAKDPSSPENVARLMNAQAHALSAQAAMLHAKKYQPGSAASGGPEGMDSLVDMFHRGEVDPSQLPGFGKARTEFLEELHKKYPDDNPAQATEDYKFASNVGVQLTLKGLENLVGPDGKSGNLQEVVKSSNDIKRTDFPAVNDVEAWARINKGDPKMAGYYAQVLEVSDQIAKVLQGGGTGSATSDAKLKQAQNLLNSGFSKDQIKGIADGLSPLLANRKGSMIGNNRYLKNQYGSAGSGGASTDSADPMGIL
jgi:hypothetical protein